MSSEDFVLHPEAARDISEIWEYIAEDNPEAAGRFQNKIVQAIRNLAAFPRQGHARPDLSSRALRFETVGAYLIAYVPDRVPLLVLAVIHGRRSPRVIAAMLRSRE
jgi:plasmid stabilization system protein ParE